MLHAAWVIESDAHKFLQTTSVTQKWSKHKKMVFLLLLILKKYEWTFSADGLLVWLLLKTKQEGESASFESQKLDCVRRTSWAAAGSQSDPERCFPQFTRTLQATVLFLQTPADQTRFYSNYSIKTVTWFSISAISLHFREEKRRERCADCGAALLYFSIQSTCEGKPCHGMSNLARI